MTVKFGISIVQNTTEIDSTVAALWPLYGVPITLKIPTADVFLAFRATATCLLPTVPDSWQGWYYQQREHVNMANIGQIPKPFGISQRAIARYTSSHYNLRSSHFVRPISLGRQQNESWK
jgi:hypothetical protein